MTKQITVRLPEDLSLKAEAIARVRGMSVNTLITESLLAEVSRVAADKDFTEKALTLLDRDHEIIRRLGN